MEATDFGTLMHSWKETGEVVGDNPRPLTKAHDTHIKTLETKLEKSGIDRETYWPAGEGEHETTFAFNPFTLELRLHTGDRGAADGWKRGFDARTWVTGSSDWSARLDGIAHIDDLKSGDWPVDPTTSKQLLTYLMVPWLQDGAPFSWDGWVSITHWPKYPLGGRPTRTWHAVTGFDMRVHLEDLKWTLTHPNEVNVIDTDRQTNKMSPCLFCECREPFPASAWMEHWLYRTLPLCMPGLIQRIERQE